MTGADAAFTGSIPHIYDERLGPFLFEPYAHDLARRLTGADRAVLETAAGTGIVTAALAHGRPTAAIVATDLNPAMLQHAAAKPGLERITWQPADAQALPFEDGRFDVVVCQFGVMFFPDQTKAFAEARRVLRPGGCFLFNVWDQLEENDAAYLVERALAELFPDDPPGFLGRTPYGHADTGRLLAMLREAGFAETKVEMVTRRGRAASAADPAIGFCQGSPLRAEIEARDPHGLERATQAAAEKVADVFGAGPIDTKLQAFVIEARG